MAVNELTLYQIGDIVLKIGEQRWHGYETQMKSTDQRMLYSREFVFGGKPRTPEPRVFTVTGILLDSSNTIPEFVGMYHSLEGVVTDLIAYQLINCCSNPDCCGCSNDWQDVLWWNTVAQIVAIKLSEGEGNTISIAITIKAQTTWTTINRFLWEWTEQKNSMRGLELPLATPSDVVIDTTGATFSGISQVGMDGFTGIPEQTAQSFTLPRNGFISQFSFISRVPAAHSLTSDDFTWMIMDGDETSGPANVLATGRFTLQHNGAGGAPEENTITLPAPLPVVFGKTYFIVIRVTFSRTTNNDLIGWDYTSPSVLSTGQRWYDTGSGWTNFSTQDLLFSVTMDYDFFGEFRPYPKIEDIFANDCKSLWARHSWSIPNIVYQPDLWQDIHNNHRHGYPITGYGTNWQNEVPISTVTANRQIFSVEPSSIYAFSNIIAGTGNILVSINRFNRNVWQNTRSDTSIDINLLNADMATAGYVGLQPSDVLIMGDTPIKPGFVMRNGAILPNVTPRINYPDSFPGELGPMFNEIRFVVPNKTMWAQLHNFRRL